MLNKNKLQIMKHRLTLSQRTADALAKWVGSWVFIIFLFVFMVFWIAMNISMIKYKWDPYPFILLNFILSTLAAIQAPVILMSQNREAERDRAKAERDYHINRKAEREVENMQKDLDEIKALIKELKNNKI